MVPISKQGFYPDPFTRRMAYDADGTTFLYYQSASGAITTLTADNARAVNDEGNATVSFGDAGNYYRAWVGFIFPELRTIHGYWVRCHSAGGGMRNFLPSTVETSPDTTNGIDGTWTSQGNWVYHQSGSGGTPPVPTYRTSIYKVNYSDIKAIRFAWDTNDWYDDHRFSNIHLYGIKSTGETPHRIDFCDADGSELLIDMDYGDQPRNSSRLWQPLDTWNQGSALYLRNRSLEKVANEITISTESLTGDMSQRLTLSKDGSTYASQVTFASIQPQAIVGPIYVKHATTTTTALSITTSRLRCNVGNWL